MDKKHSFLHVKFEVRFVTSQEKIHVQQKEPLFMGTVHPFSKSGASKL
jgi:hypothetical protein